ncbi:unnamed protein product [Arabis nemorensis]|uniref:SKP1 component POZ domain-containing protein n=1 Tax=Arabis nemorensis TaxID=586526 RepID=A0A565BNS6_9BRAS|nr:unnamed protein product [Arabis nemorensis]
MMNPSRMTKVDKVVALESDVSVGSGGESLEVDEAVALESQTIGHTVEDDCEGDFSSSFVSILCFD